jgi:hypothetical protein
MKKAQQEIIVTVLLVLIALAAVSAIAVLITKNVQQATATADQKQACLKVELDITNIDKTLNAVTVKRLGSGAVLGAVNVSVNGAVKEGVENIAPGGSAVITLPGTSLATGDKVEVAATLSDGYACQPMTEETVA